MDKLNSMIIGRQHMLDLSGDHIGLINAIVSVSRDIFSYTGMEQTDLKYLCVERISKFIFLKLLRTENIANLDEENKKLLEKIIIESSRKLNMPLPQEERAGAAPSQEVKKLEEKELKSAEDMMKIKDALDKEAKRIEETVYTLHVCREKCEEGINIADERPFSVDKIIEDLDKIIKNLTDNLRKNADFEDRLKKFAKQLFEELENVSGEQSNKIVMDQLINMVSKMAHERYKYESGEGLIPADQERLKRDPRMIRNALFVLALLSNKVAVSEEELESAYYKSCLIILKNPDLNEDLNKYFEMVKTIKDYMGMNKYAAYFNSLNDSSIKLLDLSEFMKRQKSGSKPLDALTANPNSADKVLNEQWRILTQRGEEIRKFRDDVSNVIDLFVNIRKVVAGNFQPMLAEELANRRNAA